MKYLVRLKSDEPCWLAEKLGDPGRTLIRENAQRFATKQQAEQAALDAENSYPFRRRVYSIEPEKA